MVKQNPVSVNWQTVFVFIPFVDLWAAYRIQKLRMYLLIFLVGFGIAAMLLLFASFGTVNFFMEDPEVLYSNSLYIGGNIGMTLIQFALQVYLIRKWSKQWNKKFETNEN